MFQTVAYKYEEDIVDGLMAYWTDRADGYSDVNEQELNSAKQEQWTRYILGLAPQLDRPLRVLDVGCGPGFFAISLALAGHTVTAVDITPEMLSRAETNAQTYQANVRFIESDATTLPFADNQFDLIVSRNVTWNLESPAQAYQEWHRVLAGGGRIINFDANWYLRLSQPGLRKGYEQDRQNVANAGVEDQYLHTDIRTMEHLASGLPLTRQQRPQWDLQALLDCGFKRIHIDTGAADVLWDRVEHLNNASTPMFAIAAEK